MSEMLKKKDCALCQGCVNPMASGKSGFDQVNRLIMLKKIRSHPIRESAGMLIPVNENFFTLKLALADLGYARTPGIRGKGQILNFLFLSGVESRGDDDSSGLRSSLPVTSQVSVYHNTL